MARTPAKVSILRSRLRWVAAGAGFAAGAYATSVGVSWLRYGHVRLPRPGEHDELLDRFMPAYEVVERHHVRVAAAAAVTLAAAKEIDLFARPVVRALIKARELILRAAPGDRLRPIGLLEEMQFIGWVVLAEIPDREIVVGAVTRPWEANVTFRPVPPDEFAAFDEPDYIKIAWTLRADALGATRSTFRTETRVIATNASARARFRWYWAFLSPGISLIRLAMLEPVKAEAERRAAPPGHSGVPTG